MEMAGKLTPSDFAALQRNHQFIRDEDADVKNGDNWEVRLAKRYYDKLYKE